MADDLSQIIKAFDVYISLLENRNQKITTSNITKAFSTAIFVETAIAKAKENNKEKILEDHLHGHWKITRTHLYSCSELELACDKLLEIFLKSLKITSDTIDKLFEFYIQSCGYERLNSFFDKLLKESLPTNILLHSLAEIGIPIVNIENEARILAWSDQISCGRENEVDRLISQMIDNGEVKKLLEIVSSITEDDLVKNLITKNLTKYTNNYDPLICSLISDLDQKSLQKLLSDDRDFQISFIDAIFYFGRNMTKDNNSWLADHSFTFSHLIKIMMKLLKVSDSIRSLIINRLQLAKTQVHGSIWIEVEEKCLKKIVIDE
ncbi:uncharacterized protein Ufm1 isoform X1 [Chelonus insularis]|uniref:uncharacterized protein Ufm1 isoform X1 n=1 Tax=Chelonus insularis TaxID=460826 RepID=UPI00158F147A|nr:uncharacterized protein LOC118068881 isoform X1 [Chelonus insularis]